MPICTKCGLCKFKHLQLCKCCGCGTVIVNEDLDDISEHSVYTSEDSDIQSWVAVNRKPKLPAESEDYDGDEETMGPGSPSGSVVMQVITPREYVPQDVAAEVERKRIEQEETEKRLEVEKQMRELHLKKMMEDDLKSLTDDDKRDRRIGERLDGLVHREALAKEIALEKKKKKEEQEKIERARLLKLMEAHKVKAPLAESVTDRPLIKEEDNANCADNEDSSTEDDGEADLDDDEKAERAELKKKRREMRKWQKAKKAKKIMRTTQTKRTERPMREKSPIDYRKACVSLAKPEVELVRDNAGEVTLSEYTMHCTCSSCKMGPYRTPLQWRRFL